MSSKRPPAPPPELKGFRYLSLLGSGGFSDVYLYEQDRPRRKVAVKVLLSDLRTESARRQFETEANLMAQLSSHPYIVTIYQAEITDGGHSYLAMEYCSRPSLDIRYRRERLSVDEVLAVGIQVASAVETAHRAGIAHRDIKPANILVTDYNRPALTDFGISGTVEGGGEADMGMSIPWSPPESFRGSVADGVALDVWALGATLYTLLAGRSPFVIPGGDNSQRALVQRIHSSPVPPLGRADVPESLELVLATAMSKAPESRYASAHTFALALQRIQNELSLSVTPFEVLEEPSDDDDPDSSYEETRVRGVVAINPHGPRTATARPGAAPAGAAPAGAPGPAAVPGDTTAARDTAAWGDTAARGDTGRGDTVLRGRAGTAPGAPEGLRDPGEAAEPEGDSTVLRGDRTILRSRDTGAGQTGPGEGPEDGSRGDAEGEERAAAARRRRTLLASSAAGVVLVAAVGAAIVLAPGLAGRPAPNQTTYSAPPVDAVDTGAVPNVTELKGTADASGVTFTWKNPQPRPGDAYLVTVLRLTGQQPPTTVTAARATVPKEASGQTCVRVVVRRSDGAAGPMDDSAPSACVSTK
ncbi:serine/threonine-protein kinase [Sinomonas atrocyanea]|uniref:serine/threonine-protein kinase n=1 Tax=Sinomonas atrocyanea TaxID=37927 RepID=UPI0028636DA6|nr:serine/threonine-protein kinase [Sinomonas atrocyanea]MDR6621772.1 putative Ser/Thr protein kinase [Sinomonas atrocyanea]